MSVTLPNWLSRFMDIGQMGTWKIILRTPPQVPNFHSWHNFRHFSCEPPIREKHDCFWKKVVRKCPWLSSSERLRLALHLSICHQMWFGNTSYPPLALTPFSDQLVPLGVFQGSVVSPLLFYTHTYALMIKAVILPSKYMLMILYWPQKVTKSCVHNTDVM